MEFWNKKNLVQLESIFVFYLFIYFFYSDFIYYFIIRIHPSENFPDIFVIPPSEGYERMAGNHRCSTHEVYWYVFFYFKLI